MWPLIDSEEIGILCYEKWMLSLHLKALESRLNLSCELCGGYHNSDYCDKHFIEHQVIYIDYDSELKTILVEFLRLNQVSFDIFEV